MTAEKINQYLRLFLYGMAGFIFVGTLVELIFEEHTNSPVQYIPFVLGILGLLGVLLVFWRPQRVLDGRKHRQ